MLSAGSATGPLNRHSLDDSMNRTVTMAEPVERPANRRPSGMKKQKDEAEDRSSAGRIPELDGLRAIAILLVIGCHFQGFASLLWTLPAFGWVGVDIFFVLSGFLITSILVELRGTASPIRVFYTRRILRIFPIYYIMIVIVSLISLACGEHIIHFGWYVSRVLYLQSLRNAPDLFHQVYLRLSGKLPEVALLHRTILPAGNRGADFGPWANSLSAAWSLSIEEYFYIIWAPVVIFLKSPRKVAIVAVLIFLMSVTVQYLGFTDRRDYFEFFCRIDTIMAGSILALFLKMRSKLSLPISRRVDVVAMVTGLVFALAFISVLLFIRPFLGREVRDSAMFMVAGMPSLSIVLALILGWIVLRSGNSYIPLQLLRWRPARYLGTISYSLYLFHIPVYYLFLHLAAALRLSGPVVVMVVSVLSLLTAILLSAISWKYFETPILSLKDRWAPRNALGS